MRYNLTLALVVVILLAASASAGPLNFKFMQDIKKASPVKLQAVCGNLCHNASNIGPSDHIFSSKPTTFVDEFLLPSNGGKGGSGSGCCACSTKCLDDSRCNAFLCAANTAPWTGFTLPSVNCQLFSSANPAPNTPSGIAGWWEKC